MIITAPLLMYANENWALNRCERRKTKTAKRNTFLMCVSALARFPAEARSFYALHSVEADSEATSTVDIGCSFPGSKAAGA
jgi:hypothetical protein